MCIRAPRGTMISMIWRQAFPHPWNALFSALALVGVPAALYAPPLLYAQYPVYQIALYAVGCVFLISVMILYRAFQRLHGLDRTARSAPASQAAYVLLLRSFSKTAGYVDDAHVTGTDGITVVSQTSIVNDLERAVALKGRHLVSVGGTFILRPRHGLIWLSTPDETWYETVRTLARAAAAIIVVPETSAGLQREVNLLRDEGLLGRSIWLMAPAAQEAWNVQFPEASARGAAWNGCRAALAASSIALPDYHPHGALVLPSASEGGYVEYELGGATGLLGVVRRAHLARRQVVKLADKLDAVIGGMDSASTPFAQVFARVNVGFIPDREVSLLQPPGANDTPQVLFIWAVVNAIFYNPIVFLIDYF